MQRAARYARTWARKADAKACVEAFNRSGIGVRMFGSFGIVTRDSPGDTFPVEAHDRIWSDIGRTS
jgi:hypothetical protein